MARARKASEAGRPGLAWLAQFVLPILAAAGLVAGVLWLGRLAREDNLRRGGVVAFADIECDPPPGMSRGEFLAEAGGAVEVELTPESVRRRLSEHPWVERVERVRVQPDRAEATLTYRVPVLWVNSSECAVDRKAVLLPASARRDGLLVYTGKATPIPDRPGQQWNHPGVAAAAALAGELAGKVEPRGLTVEAEDGELTLWRGARRYLWGRPPGEEKPGEQSAGAKLTRLRKALEAGEDADLR